MRHRLRTLNMGNSCDCAMSITVRCEIRRSFAISATVSVCGSSAATLLLPCSCFVVSPTQPPSSVVTQEQNTNYTPVLSAPHGTKRHVGYALLCCAPRTTRCSPLHALLPPAPGVATPRGNCLDICPTVTTRRERRHISGAEPLRNTCRGGTD